MECVRQRYNVGKLMTKFRIDGHTIKRGKLVCISVIVGVSNKHQLVNL